MQSLDVELGQEGKHMRGCLLCVVMVCFLCCFCWWTEDLHFVLSWLWRKVVMVGAGNLLGMERGRAQKLLVAGVSYCLQR